MGKRSEYWAKRANKEIEIVQNCLLALQGKSKEIGDKIRDDKATIENLELAILAEKDEHERDDMMIDLSSAERALNIHISSRADFRKVISMTKTLLNVVEAFYDKEQYKRIVKTIPEKKFESLMADVKILTGVVEMIKDVYAKFKKESVKLGINIDELNVEIEHVDNVVGQMTSMTDSKTKAQNNLRLEALRKKHGISAESGAAASTEEFVMPVEAKVDNKANNNFS